MKKFVEHPKGKILIDTGWSREISPDGTYGRAAQIRHMSFPLYAANQGEIAREKAIDEQLGTIGILPENLDYVLLTHLDCDHVSGVKQAKRAKHILVSEDELVCAGRHSIRYRASMWKGVPLSGFSFKNTGIGPVGKSFDLFEDGSVQLVQLSGISGQS